MRSVREYWTARNGRNVLNFNWDVLFPQNRQEDIAFRMLVQVQDEGNNGAISTGLLGLDVLNVTPTLDAIER